jgi:membrane protein
VSALTRAFDRVKQTRAWEAWQRYGRSNGDLLAAGVGYFAFFSIFPALALAFAIFGFVLSGRPQLLDTIATSLNTTLPGMVKTAENPTGLIGLTAPATLTLTITGSIAFVTLLLAGLGWVGALRTGIRTVFGLRASEGNAVTTKLRDLGVLVVLGLLVALSAIFTSAVGGLAGTIAGALGIPDGALLVGAAGLVTGAVFDTIVMVVLLRLLTGVSLPWRNLRRGAIFGGVAITVLKLSGGFLIGHATANPVLSAVAIPVGLLFWLNLMSRIVLFSSAWAAGDADLGESGEGVDREADNGGTPDGRLLDDGDAAGDAGAVATVVAPLARTAPSRTVDRLSVAAGAVVGAVGASAVAATRRRRRS